MVIPLFGIHRGIFVNPFLMFLFKYFSAFVFFNCKSNWGKIKSITSLRFYPRRYKALYDSSSDSLQCFLLLIHFPPLPPLLHLSSSHTKLSSSKALCPSLALGLCTCCSLYLEMIEPMATSPGSGSHCLPAYPKTIAYNCVPIGKLHNLSVPLFHYL